MFGLGATDSSSYSSSPWSCSDRAVCPELGGASAREFATSASPSRATTRSGKSASKTRPSPGTEPPDPARSCAWSQHRSPVPRRRCDVRRGSRIDPRPDQRRFRVPAGRQRIARRLARDRRPARRTRRPVPGRRGAGHADRRAERGCLRRPRPVRRPHGRGRPGGPPPRASARPPRPDPSLSLVGVGSRSFPMPRARRNAPLTSGSNSLLTPERIRNSLFVESPLVLQRDIARRALRSRAIRCRRAGGLLSDAPHPRGHRAAKVAETPARRRESPSA